MSDKSENERLRAVIAECIDWFSVDAHQKEIPPYGLCKNGPQIMLEKCRDALAAGTTTQDETHVICPACNGTGRDPDLNRVFHMFDEPEGDD